MFAKNVSKFNFHTVMNLQNWNKIIRLIQFTRKDCEIGCKKKKKKIIELL